MVEESDSEAPNRPALNVDDDEPSKWPAIPLVAPFSLPRAWFLPRSLFRFLSRARRHVDGLSTPMVSESLMKVYRKQKLTHQLEPPPRTSKTLKKKTKNQIFSSGAVPSPRSSSSSSSSSVAAKAAPSAAPAARSPAATGQVRRKRSGMKLGKRKRERERERERLPRSSRFLFFFFLSSTFS